jgi:hypothetical protein
LRAAVLKLGSRLYTKTTAVICRWLEKIGSFGTGNMGGPRQIACAAVRSCLAAEGKLNQRLDSRFSANLFSAESTIDGRETAGQVPSVTSHLGYMPGLCLEYAPLLEE